MRQAENVNRTGTSRNPELCAAMLDAVAEFPPSSEGSAHAIAEVRVAYADTARPIGSMPPPASLKQLASSAVKAVQGKQPLLLLDKLGERLAFERSGVRLYEALLSKHDVDAGFSGGPTRSDLEHILAEERAHFEMLSTCIEQLGGDPTAVTPSANLHATIAKGVVAVMTDPRTDLLQSLEATLVIELADNDCWEGLIELAEAAGEEELVDRFTEALAHEQEHLANVRAWIAAGQGRPGQRIAVAVAAEWDEAADAGETTSSRATTSRSRASKPRATTRARGSKKAGATRHK